MDLEAIVGDVRRTGRLLGAGLRRSIERRSPYLWSAIGLGSGLAVAVVAYVLYIALRPTDVVASSESSVALIKGRFSSGTGFLVASRVLVTNRHVIGRDLTSDLKIHFPSAKVGHKGPHSASVIYEDDEKDLALLSVDTDLPPLRLAANYVLRRGQEILVIGNPGVGEATELQNAVSRGVMSTQTTLDGVSYYQLGISINPGNSGGPVLDSAGRVIGVVTLKAAKQEGLGFCIPVSDVSTAIARSASLGKAQIERNRSKHRARVVFNLITVSGAMHSKGMALYSDSMDVAIRRGLTANAGLATVRDEVEGPLAAFDQVLVGGVKREVASISTDSHLPEAVRQKFVDLWTNYIELKSYVENPRGTPVTYKAKYHELTDKHNRLTEALGLLLGVQRNGE